MEEFETSPFTIEPTAEHTHTVIFLHGRGCNGPDFAAEFLESESSNTPKRLPEQFPNWKWVFPSARMRYSTVFKEEMHEWFDIYSLTDPSQREDLQSDGLNDSSAMLRKLIEKESKLISHSRIVLGGISQGCATGLHALLSGNLPEIGAFIGLSGWLPYQSKIEETSKKFPQQIPLQLAKMYDNVRAGTGELTNTVLATQVFIGHALNDLVVDSLLGLQMCNTLKALGMSVSYNIYEKGGHWITEPDEVDDLITFLSSVDEKR